MALTPGFSSALTPWSEDLFAPFGGMGMGGFGGLGGGFGGGGLVPFGGLGGLMPLIGPEQMTNMRRQMPMDLVENEKEFNLVADLPGLEKKDVKTYVDGNVLRVCAEKDEKKESGAPGTRFHRVERSSRYVERATRMPQSADMSKVSAHMENGVLTVTVPKAPETTAAVDTSRGKPITIQ